MYYKNFLIRRNDLYINKLKKVFFTFLVITVQYVHRTKFIFYLENKYKSFFMHALGSIFNVQNVQRALKKFKLLIFRRFNANRVKIYIFLQEPLENNFQLTNFS